MEFQIEMSVWTTLMKPIRYSCLGCEHCFAGSSQNAFASAFPQVADLFGLSCEIQVNAESWPPVVGEYEVVNPNATVAVVTLASVDLPKQIAAQKPEGLAITGKLETENIGVDKLIKNMTANPNLRHLIVAGIESAGHQSGQALLALVESGIDSTGRIVGAHGKRPILRNVTEQDVALFRSQVKLTNLIGCEDVSRIAGVINELAQEAVMHPLEIVPCECAGGT
jgi:tetrahydromethanopterin S-methyltransferase subunit A